MAGNNLKEKTFYDFSAMTSSGKEINMSDYEGKVVLVVNTASKCGFTPQYDGLEALYKKYNEQGLVILGFPCNQFGHQESGNDDEIQSFCKLNFGVTFPVLAKIEVNGSNTHPLYEYLKYSIPGILGTKDIKWNFTKFLINREGKPVKRFAPTDTPEKIEKDIQSLL